MHNLGYVHCDLKPNNILIDAAGKAKVIDFGQTCPVGTAKKRIQGTPDFIAPEQVKCDPVTIRTDVFNFGATLYWALAGRSLPTLFTIKKSENSFLFDDIMPTPASLNPRVPESLSNLVMECVKTNPAKRPADLKEVARRLEIIRHSMRKREVQAASSVA
jgi:eukaryotic-like serine/threonine-protein kinase